MKQRRVVCAANKYDFLLLIGARHWDITMRTAYHNLPDSLKEMVDSNMENEQQGFIDQWGEFMTREEAWKVAEAAGQILHRCGGDTRNGGTLYSENLY